MSGILDTITDKIRSLTATEPKYESPEAGVKATSAHNAYEEPKWWKEAIVYQVWPHSFCDSNGDGIGDLNGIKSKLDHIQSLGTTVIWLSPCYASPNYDFGYDISDYQGINPQYGTLNDWQALCDDINARGMKLMMDLVANHTAEEHPWFVESRSSKDSPKRDWYFWRKSGSPDGIVPPNNWAAIWGKQSAWQFDETTGEWFLRLFTGRQPDLNWENPEVREAIFKMMDWWFQRGIGGFRMDVISLISKPHAEDNYTLPNAPIVDKDQFYQPNPCTNGPRNHEFLKMMHEQVLQKYDQCNVGEFARLYDPQAVAAFVLPENKELQTLFLFEHITVDGTGGKYIPFKLIEWKRITRKWQRELPDRGAWGSVYIQNHDQARAVTRFGNDTTEFRILSAKLICMMEMTLTGTVYIYQGEEIGMTNFPADWPLSEYKDTASQQQYESVLKDRQQQTGKKPEDIDMSDVMEFLSIKARDHARTPVQWDDSEYAGFSTHEPWMKVNPNYKEINVKAQNADPDSNLAFTRKMVDFRKYNAACTYGVFDDLDPSHEQIFAYTKTHKTGKLLVLLNFSTKRVDYHVPSQEKSQGKLLMANSPQQDSAFNAKVRLEPWEGRVYSISS